MDLSKLDFANTPGKCELEFPLDKVTYNDEWSLPWIAQKFQGLGPDAHFALYCASQGIMPKEFKARLKKLRRNNK